MSGRYPNLGPEVLLANGVTLIDETGTDVFKKIKDGSKVRLYNGGVYAGDRRLIRGAERTDEEIAELMQEAKSGWSPTWKRSPATPLSSSEARARC